MGTTTSAAPNVKWSWVGTPPAAGDFVTTRDGRGYWHLRSVRVGPDDEGAGEPRLLCNAVPREGVPPAVAGSVIHPWSRTGSPAAKPSPDATVHIEIARPVSIVTPAEVEARSKLAKVKREALEAALPAHSSPGEWQDASDDLRTRTPPVVKGRKRADVLARMAKTCPAVSREMVLGAHEFRCLYEQSVHGFSSGTSFSEHISHTAAGPKDGPGRREMKRLASQKAINGLVHRVGFGAQKLLRHLLVEDKDIASFCRDPAHADPVTGRAPDRRETVGAACFLLQIVAEHLGVVRDVRIQDQQGRRD